MRKWWWAAVFAFGVVFGVPTRAQETPPIGPVATLEAVDLRALAVTTDGAHLMTADAENNQLRVYDISEVANPTLRATLDLDGEPVALAASDFALVALATEGEADLLQVIDSVTYDPRQPFATVNFLDLPKTPRIMAISPDSRWAVIGGEAGYTLLQLESASDIPSSDVGSGDPVIDVALTTTTAFLLREDGAFIETALLTSGAIAQAGSVIPLDAPALHIATNLRGTLGAAALEDGTLVFFDPTTLQLVGTFALENGDLLDMQFAAREDGEWLVVAERGANEFRLLDVTDPANVGELAAQPVAFEVRAMTVYNTLVIVSDGQAIQIFSVA